jgi:hypothetical protein
MASQGIAYWPAFPLVVVFGMFLVAGLERWSPHVPDWNRDHGDTRVDVLHWLGSQVLIQVGVASPFGLRSLITSELSARPESAPMGFRSYWPARSSTPASTPYTARAMCRTSSGDCTCCTTRRNVCTG